VNITRLTKDRWQDPEWKAKVLENRKLANQRPEVIENRKKMYDALRGKPRDPAIIEKGTFLPPFLMVIVDKRSRL
jgi:hypothetical protein